MFMEIVRIDLELFRSGVKCFNISLHSEGNDVWLDKTINI